MKSSNIAVIGAGYGDEGKGLFVDFLACRTPGSIVVRSNGGAQAGHTVERPDLGRHVFHHFGSGALAGAPTHLSRFFVVNPMVFDDERRALVGLEGTMEVSVDPRALVTTPYDVMINQILETNRDRHRHGSCGLGFGETIERSLEGRYRITAGDLGGDVLPVLERIRREWCPKRLGNLGISTLSQHYSDLIADDGILSHFVEDCAEFASGSNLMDDRALAGRQVIFEGAQGLLLDQDYGAFPHVTRSNTGLRNIASISAEAGISAIQAVYVTRPYVTRHGAGPLCHEADRLDYADVTDRTNLVNEWQGTLRFGQLDIDVLRRAIDHDIARVQGKLEVEACLAVSCLDQITGAAVPIRSRSGPQKFRKVDFTKVLASSIVSIRPYACSYGPTREDVRLCDISHGRRVA